MDARDFWQPDYKFDLIKICYQSIPESKKYWIGV